MKRDRKGDDGIMKKLICVFAAVVMLISLCGCSGDVSDVKTHMVKSAIFNQNDIDEGIAGIKREFRRKWQGCTLKELYYAGDEMSQVCNFTYSPKKDNVMVLMSSFDVDSSGCGGTLTANSTYENWKWVLVRNDSGRWCYVDHGY